MDGGDIQVDGRSATGRVGGGEEVGNTEISEAASNDDRWVGNMI